ncbi:MAG: hypothetical protein K5866_10385 [Treponema sp.]|nr:hypothetical protein [Treponema sp.]
MNKKFILGFTVLLLINTFAFCDDWVIAAEKFTYSRGQKKNAITEASAESLPSQILDKLGNTLVRSILPDEVLERKRYDLRTERLSLYLQLSSEYKKRDAIFLNNYSKRELKSKLAEKDKDIKEIEEKIEENLKTLKEAEEKAQINNQKLENLKPSKKETGELDKYSALFKNLISNDQDIISVENIVLYKNDNTSLFSASPKAKKEGYSSYLFESEIKAAKINTLLTGVITSYGDYTSVTLSAYSYPGGKLIASVTDIGSLQDMDHLTSNIARQLVPLITNSMPVKINFSIEPKEAAVELYIDDMRQISIPENFIMDSGIHNLQFVAKGYESLSVDYFFDGNKNYSIEVTLNPLYDGYVQLGLIKAIPGLFYADGILAQQIDSRKSKIKVNGKAIMGEFISQDGLTDFYYIPEKLSLDGKNLVFKAKPKDRNEYIDKRRKWMYGAYSALIVSLMPSFYTYGNYYNTAALYNDDNFSTEENYYTAKKWEKAYKISSRISVACGAFFLYEMVRYFLAADSVLPGQVKVSNKKNNYIFEEDFPIEIPGTYDIYNQENVDSSQEEIPGQKPEENQEIIDKTENIENSEPNSEIQQKSSEKVEN